MLVLAADHVIQNEEAFRTSVRNAIPYAESGKLVTFGIVPDMPETGYGYIRRGEVCEGKVDAVAFNVAQFVEKPNSETAQGYVATGEYYWNSGMFLFRAGRFPGRVEKIPSGHSFRMRKGNRRPPTRIWTLSVSMKRRFLPARKSRLTTR